MQDTKGMALDGFDNDFSPLCTHLLQILINKCCFGKLTLSGQPNWHRVEQEVTNNVKKNGIFFHRLEKVTMALSQGNLKSFSSLRELCFTAFFDQQSSKIFVHCPIPG